MQAVLGIAGSRRDASVALSIDGRLVAAASEDAFIRVPRIGYAQTGGAPSNAIAACLRIGNLEPGDLSAIALVNDRGENPVASQLRTCSATAALDDIDPIEADAIQASCSDSAAAAVVIASVEPPALIGFTSCDGGLRIVSRARGWETLTCAAAELSHQLGIFGDHSFSGLAHLGNQGEPDFFGRAEPFRWSTVSELSVTFEGLTRFVESLVKQTGGELCNPESVNVHVQGTRRNLAASFVAALTEVLRHFAEDIARTTGSSSLVFGGELFENAHLNTRVHEALCGQVSFSAVPGHRGRAIGAALKRWSPANAVYDGLAVGPVFKEQEIKNVLENCRIDYVYEPDWDRLIKRVSKMLARGIIVGWFQGPAGFGPTSLGSRSILCDPSRPYVRENINGYLRRTTASDPLPISLTPAAAQSLFGPSMASPFMLLRAAVPPAARAHLRAAIDGNNHVQFHTATSQQAPELCQLLDFHHTHTGVPGLINLNLVGPGEPTACSPRDAVRTFYSSAIDALVIGRFLLMKDYWLLRSDQG